MLKHREIIGQGSHQTEPGVLPGQSPIMVRVYPTTRRQARRHQALGCQWGPGNQRALLWKPIFISLFFFFHPFALPTAVLIIFMNAPFQCSAGFQSVAMEEVWHILWHTGQEQKCILRTVPKLSSFCEADRKRSNGLAVERQFWMAVCFMTLNLFLLQLLVSWLTPPSRSHSCCAVSFCNSFPYISLYAAS